jgi:hypothetical protein
MNVPLGSFFPLLPMLEKNNRDSRMKGSCNAEPLLYRCLMGKNAGKITGYFTLALKPLTYSVR